MIKKHEIYKTDKWNMMTVEVQGKTLVLREISDQWGEETHIFLGRPALKDWIDRRFPKEDFAGREAEWDAIMTAVREV